MDSLTSYRLESFDETINAWDRMKVHFSDLKMARKVAKSYATRWQERVRILLCEPSKVSIVEEI